MFYYKLLTVNVGLVGAGNILLLTFTFAVDAEDTVDRVRGPRRVK